MTHFLVRCAASGRVARFAQKWLQIERVALALTSLKRDCTTIALSKKLFASVPRRALYSRDSTQAYMNLIKMTKKPRHSSFRRARSRTVQARVPIQKRVKTIGIWLFDAKENFLNSQRCSDFSPNTFVTKNCQLYFWFIQHYMHGC